jgi:hypothetical protein
MLALSSIELCPCGWRSTITIIITITLVIIIILFIVFIIIFSISSSIRVLSRSRRKTTVSIHGEIKVLKHLIINRRHLPSRCMHKLYLRSRRRNRVFLAAMKSFWRLRVSWFKARL